MEPTYTVGQDKLHDSPSEKGGSNIFLRDPPRLARAFILSAICGCSKPCKTVLVLIPFLGLVALWGGGSRFLGQDRGTLSTYYSHPSSNISLRRSGGWQGPQCSHCVSCLSTSPPISLSPVNQSPSLRSPVGSLYPKCHWLTRG